jgi:hypothetical protein
MLEHLAPMGERARRERRRGGRLEWQRPLRPRVAALARAVQTSLEALEANRVLGADVIATFPGHLPLS